MSDEAKNDAKETPKQLIVVVRVNLYQHESLLVEACGDPHIALARAAYFSIKDIEDSDMLEKVMASPEVRTSQSKAVAGLLDFVIALGESAEMKDARAREASEEKIWSTFDAHLKECSDVELTELLKIARVPERSYDFNVQTVPFH